RYQAEDAERIAPWLVLSTINDEGTSPAGPAGSGGDSASWMLLVWATVASAAVLRVLVNWVNRLRRKGGEQ
ncbi:MAG: hypothetical protein ACKO5E_14215, partial [bacterium]